MTKPTAGTMRLFPDVIVQPNGDDEWIAMGREAAVPGETLILDVVMLDPDDGERRHQLPVCVIESRPVIVDGDMLYRIRLHGATLGAALFEEYVGRGY